MNIKDVLIGMAANGFEEWWLAQTTSAKQTLSFLHLDDSEFEANKSEYRACWIAASRAAEQSLQAEREKSARLEEEVTRLKGDIL